jgi:hypothetical protein
MSVLNSWADQPGVNPSIRNDPNYWMTRINQTGGLGQDNLDYWNGLAHRPEGAPEGGNFQNGQWNPSQGQPYGGVSWNAGVPQDLTQLRSTVGQYLNANFNQGPTPYGGTFNLGMPMGAAGVMGNSANMVGAAGGILNQGLGTLGNLSNFSASSDMSPLMSTLGILLGGGNTMQNIQPGVQSMLQGGLGAGQLGAAGMGAANIAATGGAPIQQLLQSLQAIQTQGQGNIGRNLAQIREQYSAQGLGQGSDVNNAMALGATQGQQGIEAQQSALLTSILQQASQTQLGGINALGNIGGALNQSQNAGLQALLQGSGIQQQGMLGGLQQGQSIINQPVQNALASAGINLGAASQYGNYANALTNAYGTSNQGYGQIAGLNQNANLYTNQQGYQDFLRMQGLTPQQQAAMQYSTAFPPLQNQLPSTGAQLGSSALAAGGSILASILPFMLFSDQNSKTGAQSVNDPFSVLSDRREKEKITPFRRKLEALPISTWFYKGDDVKHIGPMAQDFKRTFGVGSDHVIYPVDVLGVLLQTQKEMSAALADRGI